MTGSLSLSQQPTVSVIWERADSHLRSSNKSADPIVVSRCEITVDGVYVWNIWGLSARCALYPPDDWPNMNVVNRLECFDAALCRFYWFVACQSCMCPMAG